MRAYTAAEDTTLAATSRTTHLRVFVKDGDGIFRDLSTQGGANWVISCEIDRNLAQPVAQATIRLRRAGSSTQSLSPLRTDSTLNRNGAGAYAPLLDLAREFYVEAAVTAPGGTPVAADWKSVFRGYIDTIEFSQEPVVVTGRDLGGRLVDTQIETAQSYGSQAGVAVETVMQQLLDNSFGVGAIPLYTPVSPNFLISPAYSQQPESVLDALVNLAGTVGWDVRYEWDDGTSSWRLTFREPPRSNTTAAYTYGPSRYRDVRKLDLDLANVRNAIGGEYTDATTKARTTSNPVVDTTSIAKYRRRFARLIEASDSPIDSAAEMTALQNAALSDLKDPPAEQHVILPFDWRVMLNDVYTFSANGVHYDQAQTWAVAGVRHTLSPTAADTTITTRARPSGSYLTWLSRSGLGRRFGEAFGPRAIITAQAMPDETSQTLTFDAKPGLDGTAAYDYTITVRKGRVVAQTYTGNPNSLPLPQTLTITRDPRYAQVVEYVVTDSLTGQAGAAAYYTVEAARPYVNAGGAPIRAAAYDDGYYAVTATDTAGHAIDAVVTDSASRAVNRMYAKALPADPDTLDSVVDGVSYGRPIATRLNGGKPVIDFTDTFHINRNIDAIPDGTTYVRTTPVQQTGGGRAYTGLDSASRVVTGVNIGATLGPRPIERVLAGAETSLFRETFDALDGRWSQEGNVAFTLSTGTGVVGANSIQSAGNTSIIRWIGGRIPYNRNKLHRIRCGMQQTVNPTVAGNSLVYVGVRCYDASGAVTNANSGNAYVCIAAYALTTADGYKEFTGFFKGVIGITSNSPNSTSDPTQAGKNANYGSLSAATVEFEPVIYANYPNGGAADGTCRVDYLEIDVLDEDLSERGYHNLTGVDSIAGSVIQADSSGSRAMMRGYQSGYARHAAALSFSPAFKNIPQIRISGAAREEPRAKWGATGSGSPSETGTLNAGIPQYQDFGASSLTNAAITIRARLRQKGGGTLQTDAWPAGGTVTTAGGTTSSLTPTLTASDGNYVANVSASITQTYDIDLGGTQTVTVIVALDVSVSGGVYTEVATRSLSSSRSTTGNQTVSTTWDITTAQSGAGSTLAFRVRIKSVSDPVGLSSYSVTANNVHYSSATGDQYANATPDVDDVVLWEAWEAGT